jgi:hypothetical protein
MAFNDVSLKPATIVFKGNNGIFALAGSANSEVLLSAGTIVFVGQTHQVPDINGVQVSPGTMVFAGNLEETNLPSFVFEPLTFLIKDNLSIENYTLFPFLALKEHTETQQWLTEVLNTSINEFRFSIRKIPRTIYKYKYVLNNVEDYTLTKQLIDRYMLSQWYVPAWNQVLNVKNVEAIGIDIIIPKEDLVTLEVTTGSFCLIYYGRNNYQINKVSSVSPSINTISFENPFTTSSDSCWLIPLKKCLLSNHNFTRTANNTNLLTCDFLEIETFSLYDDSSSQLSVNYPIDFLTLSTRTIAILPVKTQGSLQENFTQDFTQLDNSINQPLITKLQDTNQFNLTYSILAMNRQEIFKLKNILAVLKGKFTEFLIPSFSIEARSNTSSLPSTSEFITTDKFYGLDIAQPKFIKIIGNYIHYAQVISITITGGNLETIHFTPALPNDLINILTIEELYLVRSNTDNFEIIYEANRLNVYKAFCNIPLVEIPINI